MTTVHQVAAPFDPREAWDAVHRQVLQPVWEQCTHPSVKKEEDDDSIQACMDRITRLEAKLGSALDAFDDRLTRFEVEMLHFRQQLRNTLFNLNDLHKRVEASLPKPPPVAAIDWNRLLPGDKRMPDGSIQPQHDTPFF